MNAELFTWADSIGREMAHRDHEKFANVLTENARERIAPKNFALPGGKYPINDKVHGRNALARVSQFGTPQEKIVVRAKVHTKYPGIGKE